MFLVFNKDKICSYMVALSIVIVLFVMGTTLNKTTQETSTKQSVNAINVELLNECNGVYLNCIK